LYNPDKLLARVVEVELDLVGGRGDGLPTSELQGLNQVLVSYLGELTTLVSVQVDVVNIQGGSYQASIGYPVADDVVVAGVLGCEVPAHGVDVVELQVDTNLVVLQGDQRQSQTGVPVEPEDKGDVQGVLRGASLYLVRGVGCTRTASRVAVLTTLDKGVYKLRDVTNHLGVTSLLARLLGELIPDLEPVTVVLVNALTTNLQLDGADEVVTRPVQPPELSTRAVAGLENYGRQGGLEVHAEDQVTITLNGASYTLAKIRSSVEGIFNGLHGKVRVTPVHYLEECNLRITSQINVLSTIGYELH
jgi:hypothetical protein